MTKTFGQDLLNTQHLVDLVIDDVEGEDTEGVLDLLTAAATVADIVTRSN